MPKISTSSPALDDSAAKPEETPTKAEDEFKDATETYTEKDEKAVDVAIAPPGAVADAAANTGSKKRAREDEDGADEQGNTKKVDLEIEKS